MFDYARIINLNDDAEAKFYEITYDISHINPDWLFLVQRFDHHHLEFGYDYYLSSFDVVDKHGNFNLSVYPKKDKAQLWQVIFGLKEYLLTVASPDIVEHFVDSELASFRKRCSMYMEHLQPEGYTYVTDKQSNAFHLIKTVVYTDLKWGEYEYYEF